MTAIYDHDIAEANGRRPSMTIWAIGAAVVLFLGWAAIAWVAEIVHAPGAGPARRVKKNDSRRGLSAAVAGGRLKTVALRTWP